MGASKTNPNSILKKQGLLPPKPPNMSAEERRIMHEEAFNRAYGPGVLGLLNFATKERR